MNKALSKVKVIDFLLNLSFNKQIIVLLILAGVSIAMLTGQNGLLSQAINAKDETIIDEGRMPDYALLNFRNYCLIFYLFIYWLVMGNLLLFN